jgi:hypothetical protein
MEGMERAMTELVIYGTRIPTYQPRSDDETRYDANERGRIDAEVLRSGGRTPVGGSMTSEEAEHFRTALFGSRDEASEAAPVPFDEPPIFTVIAFRVRMSGRDYAYAAVRAGDGKWYATGGATKQGVDWQTLVRAVRPRLAGPIQIMQPARSLFV